MKNNTNIKSYSGFISILSFIVLLVGICILSIEATAVNYTGTSNLSFYNFLFDYKEFSLSTSILEFNESKNVRLYGLFIPLFIFITSLSTYLFTKKNGDTNNRIAFFNAIMILGITGLVGLSFIVAILLSVITFFIFNKYKLKQKLFKKIKDSSFNTYLKNSNIPINNDNLKNNKISNKYQYFSQYKEFIKTHKKNKLLNTNNDNALVKKNTLIKTILFLFSIQFVFLFFILHISGNIVGKHNHYLNNNVTGIMNSLIGNSCLHGKDNTFYKLSVESCYHKQFDNKINDTEMLFLSLIDENGGILDFTNYEYVIKSITDATNKDKINLYQKTFEGLVSKNNKFKSQKYYNQNIKPHEIGDSIIKNEKVFYDLSHTLSTEKFIEYIKKSEKGSLIISNVFKEEEEESVIYTKISMEDIKKIEYRFKHTNNIFDYKKGNLYADIFWDYERFLLFFKT
jgi:hypothetical protein